jgi:microcystin-dependent protein
VRISATNIRLATTLALAQNETPDITVSGSGSVTITHTMTARTLGEAGGEEGHAMSITELLAHTHTGGNVAGTNVPFGGTVTVGNTGSTGGNAAMNIMQPFGVVKKIISY